MVSEPNHVSTIGDVLNALVRYLMHQPGGMEEVEGCWDHCHTILSQIEHKQRSTADPTSGVMPGLAKRMRALAIADLCGKLIHPDDDTKRELVTCARYSLAIARGQRGEARAFAIAEMKLSLLLCHEGLEAVGLDDDELLALEREYSAASAPA